MINPNFDPLEELRGAQHMINQLIEAHNAHDELLMAYSKQHEQLVKLLNLTQKKINRLEQEVKQLKHAAE